MRPSKRLCTADMISKVPDPLLSDIVSLSEITTRDVVQVSLLSKRWRNIWCDLSHLRFELRQFKPDEHDNFANFVDAVLSCRNETYLHTLYLSCAQFKEERHHASVWRWINHAILHHARVLKIDTNVDTVLPGAIFTFESLEELELSIHKNRLGIEQIVKLTNGVVNLPRLKKLHLKGKGIYLDCMHLNEILSGCPVLEELWLEEIDFFWAFRISSVSVKYLKIRDSSLGFFYTIDAPKLTNFEFCSHVSRLLLPYEAMHVPSLTEARIKIAVYKTHNAEIVQQLDQFLQVFLKVKNLHLSTEVVSEEEWRRDEPSDRSIPADAQYPVWE